VAQTKHLAAKPDHYHKII